MKANETYICRSNLPPRNARWRLRTCLVRLAAAVFILALPLRGEWHSIGALAASGPDGATVTFRGSDVTVTLAMLAPDLVRVRMARSGTSFPDGLSVLAKTNWPAPSFDFRRAPNGVLIRTSENDLEEINRKSIELRYRLLPYLYNVFYEASRTGLPVMRALLLDFPDDAAAVDQPHEFLWGNDLLVAPVTKDDEKTWPVYLPRGVWFDFWTDRRYTGPARIVVGAPLDRVPVFVRGGAIIPAQEVVQFVDQAPLDPLILEIYPAGASSREYYEPGGWPWRCESIDDSAWCGVPP